MEVFYGSLSPIMAADRKVLEDYLFGQVRCFFEHTSPFFPGILLLRKPSKPQGKHLVFEKNDG